MTRHSRVLGGLTSPPSTSLPLSPSAKQSPTMETLNSDFVVILAALLCALICVIGLVAVARCAWIRRLSGRAAAPPPLPQAANKGLKKKVLKSLPKLTYGADGGEEVQKLSDCAICLAEFVAGEEVRVLPQCGHGFHVVCVDTWLGSHSTCPSCRQILVVARCQKCGGVPAATTSSSFSAAPAGGSEPEPCSTVGAEHSNRFLP